MRTPPPPELTCGFLIQQVFTSGHQSVTPFLSGAPPPKKNPGSAPGVNSIDFSRIPLHCVRTIAPELGWSGHFHTFAVFLSTLTSTRRHCLIGMRERSNGYVTSTVRNGTNLSLMCKAAALFLKSLLLHHVQSLKLVLLSALFIQEIDYLLLLLFNLCQIFTSWAQKIHAGLQLFLLFLW